MPFSWLQVLSHPTTKDKASLLLKLKYEMTIDDVHDLIEHQEYEDWITNEQNERAKKQGG